MDKATEELREQIARRICTLNLSIRSWGELDRQCRDSWLREADQIIKDFNQWLEEQGCLSIRIG